MATNICGVCKNSYTTEEQYVSHVCGVTGRTPAEAAHFGTNFLRQSKEALRRSGSLSEEKEAAIDAEIEAAQADDVDDKLMRAHLEE